MLRKYKVDIDIIDIRELLQRSRFEERLAQQGSNLESAYYIATGKVPNLESHNGCAELEVIFELYKKTTRLKKKELLTVMPHGHCAGMPLRQYCEEYRRAADGYRYNNDDLLSKSLTAHIPVYEWDDSSDEDDDWDDDEDFD